MPRIKNDILHGGDLFIPHFHPPRLVLVLHIILGSGDIKHIFKRLYFLELVENYIFNSFTISFLFWRAGIYFAFAQSETSVKYRFD